MFFAAGTALERNRRDAARVVMDAHPTLTETAGATSPNAQMVVVRVLAQQMEPAMKLLKAVRVAWREVLWGVGGGGVAGLGNVGKWTAIAALPSPNPYF